MTFIIRKQYNVNRTEPNRTEPNLAELLTNSKQNSDLEQAFLNKLDSDLWASANKLRTQMDASQYKHIVLGLIFLKYLSDSFELFQQHLSAELSNPDSDLYLDPEDYSSEDYQQALADELNEPDYYLANNILFVPAQARWSTLKNMAALQGSLRLPTGEQFNSFSEVIDHALDCIEQENDKLKGVLEKISRYGLADSTLRELVNLFSDTNFSHPVYQGQPLNLSAKDILGHIYEYFLGQFALAEGKKGGQYFTPKSIVSLIVEMLEPYQGRIYDPAMGAGGFFVQSEKFIRQHTQGNANQIICYGQEFNPTTWKLATMNMVIRNLDFNFGARNADTFSDNQHPTLRADFVMANPPFNVSEWWNKSLADDPRWQYGIPPQGNANFAWLQHMIYHLSPKGKMALLLANGSMSSQTNNEGEIRKNILKADLVEAMIALPSQLFTNTQIPACIWVLNKAKARKGEVLFIDARQIGYMKDRTLRDFSAEDIAKVANTYHQWQQSQDYQDVPAFCKSATLAEIEKNDWVLTPGRYVGTAEQEDDGIPFAEKMQNLTALLNEQFKQSAELEGKIRENLKELGYE